ncbi:MAG: hypothetical protein ACPGJS_10775 [Flammeovirgaceae bacterium]
MPKYILTLFSLFFCTTIGFAQTATEFENWLAQLSHNDFESDSTITKIINTLEAPNFPFQTFKKNYKPLESDNHRLSIFSLDLHNEGSYQPFANFLCYEFPNGKRMVKLLDYVMAIDQVEELPDCCGTNAYLLSGTLHGCISCVEHIAFIINVNENAFDEIASVSLATRDYSKKLTIDTENNLIAFDFTYDPSDEHNDLRIENMQEDSYSLKDDPFIHLRFSKSCSDSTLIHVKGIISITLNGHFQLGGN